MKEFALTILAVLLLAGTAIGATPATKTSHSSGVTFNMCTLNSVTGVCDSDADGNGTDLFASVSNYQKFTAYFSQSGTGAVCDIYVGDAALGAAIPTTLATTDGTKINPTQLSSSSTAQSFEAPFYIMWVTCTVGTGTHTVTIQASK
jgi:hypothetical protein